MEHMQSFDDNRNPQEPPPPPSSAASSKSKRRLPTCIFDLFFDLPHPAVSNNDKAKIVDPPVTVSPLLSREMHKPDNIARISRLAFPEHDDASPREAGHARREGKLLTSRGRTFGAHLTKHDVYHVDFAVHHHTFSLLLSDGRTRAHGHVRRYLPSHGDSGFRMDVGRRRPRAMVLLTRAMGGERFYSSVLKTMESIIFEAQVNKRGCFAKKKDPTRSFLHALFNAHATLITQYAELRRHGLSLNFTQAKLDGTRSACETAKAIMEENEDLFRITLDKVEFGSAGSVGGGGGKKGVHVPGDVLRFYLPSTLQPGFECLPPGTIPEDIASPVIPLLRHIGPSHFVRLISALLCERRVVLVSKSITRLSMCVRAASSVLAQGLLLWRHVLIPVLPPHMLRFLSVQAPYLVGILHPFADRLGKIEGLTDVLCVNLDKNELKTLNMANPRSTVPDMLKKISKKMSSESVGAAECLARDLDEIVKADQTLWQQDEHKAGGGIGLGLHMGIKENALDISESVRSAVRVDSVAPTKQSFVEKMKNPMKRHVSNAKQRNMSLEEKRQYESSVDAAVAFGKMIRKSFQQSAMGDQDDGADWDGADSTEQLQQQPAAPKYSAPSHDVDVGSGVEACIVAENEGGEEDVRAALTCFFIHMYGDMGMYLSETQGTFWLDRRKLLLRKKQLGEKENSPTFVVLQKFSASDMFARHVKGRIEDMSMTARDRSSIMPHHIPLFDVCSKYLSVHRLDFSLINVRRIVAKTVLACTRHIAVERHVAIRTMALALTDDALFSNGNVAEAMTKLVDSCHECNTNLGVVMSVVWHRLNQAEESKKTNMHILLALNLLKNLVSHGPLTAITEALDGAGKIYELKSYSDSKSVDHNYEVRQAADHVYSLLVDLSTLFGRRRRIAFSKAQQSMATPTNPSTSWSHYLVGRLPPTIDAQKLHALFRPAGMGGSYFHEASTRGSAALSVADDRATSIMRLSRLGENLRNSRESMMYEGDGVEDSQNFEASDDDYSDDTGVSPDKYFDDSGVSPDQYLDDSGVSPRYLDGSAESRYIPPEETAPVGESMRSPGPRTVDDVQYGRGGHPEDAGHGVSAEDLFSEADQKVSFPPNSFAPEDGASMLESFNYAVSSTAGSQFGSQYGSERSSSPPPTNTARPTNITQDASNVNPSMRRISEVMRDFSFPGDAPHGSYAPANEETEGLQASLFSNYGHGSEQSHSVAYSNM